MPFGGRFLTVFSRWYRHRNSIVAASALILKPLASAKAFRPHTLTRNRGTAVVQPRPIRTQQKEPGATDRDRGLMARHRRKLTLHSGRRMCNTLSYFSMKRGSDRELLEPTGEPKKTPTKLSGATAFWSGDRDAFGRQTERVCLLGKDGCQVLPVEGIGLDMIFNPPKPGIPRK